MRWFAALVLASTLPLAAGCAIIGGVCSAPDPVLGPDGGAYRCTKAEDCPRPGNIPVCTSTDDYARDCVDCIATSCERYSRAVCDGGRF